jgi:hypothetical protein
MHHWFYLLVAAIWIAAWIFNRFFGPKPAARKLADQMQKLYSTEHEYAPVKAGDFRDIDRAYYDRMQAELEACGFRCLGDFEDITTSSVYPSMRTFLRRFTGENGTVTAAVYEIKYRGFIKLFALFGVLSKTPYYVDLETEFTDGTFLCTANTEDSKGTAVPGIIAQRQPQSTTTEELLALHRTKLAEMVSQGLTPRVVTNSEEYQAMQHRQQELKNRHRRAEGFVDLEHVKALAEDKGTAQHNGKLFEELAAIQRQNKATPPPIPTEPRTTVVP